MLSTSSAAARIPSALHLCYISSLVLVSQCHIQYLRRFRLPKGFPRADLYLYDLYIRLPIHELEPLAI